MSAATLLALIGALIAAGLAGLALIERRAARSRARHQGELALHRHQLRITLARSERLAARVEDMIGRAEASEPDAAEGTDCTCERCAHLTIALALREHTAPWVVPIAVGVGVPRRVGLAVRWGWA